MSKKVRGLKKRQRLQRMAGHLPRWAENIVASKTKNPRRALRGFGSNAKWGAASEVRLISIEEYEAEQK